MDKKPKVGTVEVGALRDWLDGRRPLAELLREQPWLRSEAEAQHFLDGLRESLDDLANGRYYTTEEVFAELARRRAQRRAAA